MKTITSWKGGHRFESSQEGNAIQLDGSLEEGMSPKALLLSGLAGCTGIDVVDILQKMHVEFSDLVVTAEAEQTTEHPKVFTEIQLKYSLHTAADQADKVRKAIDLSLDKYCGVAAMLRKNSPITYIIDIH